MNLISRLKELVAEERRITVEVLQLLLEVDRTRLFAERGFSSLFDFCVKELGYSEAAAYRRISAMRLLRENEEVKEKLEQGALTLCAAAKIQTLVKRAKKEKQPLSPAERKELIDSSCGLTTRQVEKKLGLAPKKSTQLAENLERLKALLSHKMPGASEEEILVWATSQAIAKLEKTQCDSSAESKTRHVPAKLKAAVRQRDGGKCTYQDPQTGRKCTATHFLEFDHRAPFSLGGSTKFRNLRLLCRTHNQLMAQEAGLARSPPLN